MASPARFERAAFRLGGERSILLSYGDRSCSFYCFSASFSSAGPVCPLHPLVKEAYLLYDILEIKSTPEYRFPRGNITVCRSVNEALQKKRRRLSRSFLERSRRLCDNSICILDMYVCKSADCKAMYASARSAENRRAGYWHVHAEKPPKPGGPCAY